MASVGITSPPAPSAFASAAYTSSNASNSSSRLRLRSLPTRFAAAAPFRGRCAAAAAAAGGGAEFSEGASAVAEFEGNPDAGTDVAGGAATSTRPPYSLISAENVQKAMRGLAITEADHYGRLGVTKSASADEVTAAYEKRCHELNSRKLEEEELSKELNLLKESFTILSTDEERRLYDWSLSRSGQPERYVWPFQVDALELAPEPPKEPEDENPTTLVGYFFLAMFILSVALSVTLNR